jgi:hypothetical protein
MATRAISAKDLPKALREEARKVKGAIRSSQRVAAQRGKAHLIAETDRKGITDRGQYKSSFKVRGQGSGGEVVLENDSPIAGVIELGARPHPVSEEGREAIRAWVARKMLGISAADAEDNLDVEAITRAIVEKIRRHGQDGRFVFRDALPTLNRFLREEVERRLKGGAGR